MIKDNQGNYFAKVKVCGTQDQLLANIKLSDAKNFPEGSRAKIVSKSGIEITKRIRLTASGRQKCVTIPKSDWDIIKKGDIIKIYPMENRQNGMQVQAENQV